MLQAGADQVVSPYKISGRRMALSALQPLIVDFMETVASPDDQGERIFAELEVAAESQLAGKTLEHACLGTSIVVLGIRSGEGGSMAVGPRGDTQLRPGDRLIVMGSPDELDELAPSVSRPRG